MSQLVASLVYFRLFSFKSLLTLWVVVLVLGDLGIIDLGDNRGGHSKGIGDGMGESQLLMSHGLILALGING